VNWQKWNDNHCDELISENARLRELLNLGANILIHATTGGKAKLQDANYFVSQVEALSGGEV
jgi:hypothetical protein